VVVYDDDLGTLGNQPYPDAGPEVPLKVVPATAATVDLTLGGLPWPVPWPDSPPSIAPDEALTITENPAIDAGGDPVPPYPYGPSLDFTPVTGLDPGGKFPFGFYCDAQTVTGWFDVTPQAPDFDLTVANPDFLGGGYLAQHYDVNLDVMDSYMAIWRSILSVVFWIGGVYYVATRLLGFNAGGDVGAAVDDVL